MPQAAKTGAYRKKINPPRVYTITNAPNAVYTTCCRRERKKSAANAGRYSIWKGEVEIGSALILLPFCLYRHKSTVPTSNINTEWCSSAANHCQPAIWPNYLRGGGRGGGGSGRSRSSVGGPSGGIGAPNGGDICGGWGGAFVTGGGPNGGDISGAWAGAFAT